MEAWEQRSAPLSCSVWPGGPRVELEGLVTSCLSPSPSPSREALRASGEVGGALRSNGEAGSAWKCEGLGLSVWGLGFRIRNLLSLTRLSLSLSLSLSPSPPPPAQISNDPSSNDPRGALRGNGEAGSTWVCEVLGLVLGLMHYLALYHPSDRESLA